MKRNRTTLAALASPLAINPRTGAGSSLPANDVPPEERHLAETCGLDPAEAHRQGLPEGGWRHIFAAFVLAVLAIAPRVWAAPGDLDPSFRGTGVARTVIRGRPFVSPGAGTATSGGQSRFAVVRYDTDGSLDPTFGGGMGIVTTLVRGDAHATAAVQQPDGKIIVAGYSLADFICLSAPVECRPQFTLMRYEIDGTLDKSFGAQNSGTVTSPPGYAFGLLQQPDGRLVAAGSSSVGKHGVFAVVRYLD